MFYIINFRWLLLTFKREFSFDDGLKIFEIIYSGHLEPHSYEGAMAVEQQRILEIERGGP